MAFVKGQSGNPGGRRKIATEIIEASKRHGPKAIDFLARLMSDEKKPLSQRVIAAKELLDRGFGRPAQAVKVAGDKDQPLHMQHTAATDALIEELARLRKRLEDTEPEGEE